jgi:U3 small nucleolar RNA-associated protein 22
MADESEMVDYDAAQQHFKDDQGESGDDDAEAPPAKRSKSSGGDSKYALPTPAEAAQLMERDASTATLFKSNLLRLEVTELLEEVRVGYHRTAAKQAEAFLFELKQVLESMPSATVTAQSVKGTHINLSQHSEVKPVTLEFASPAAVDVVGSYLLRTIVKPSMNIDIAVEMPASCFHPKDFMNHKYFDKRALYVGHMAQQLNAKVQQSSLSLATMQIADFKGDSRKPCILLKQAVQHSSKSSKSSSSSSSSGWVIRLLPSIGTDVILPKKLVPSRSNCRRLRDISNGNTDTVTDTAVLPPTPHYNSAILEDMMFTRHLTALHTAISESEPLRDAIMLAKVWLGQRGHRTVNDSIDGYSVSMLLLNLLQSRAVSSKMGALQLFQGLIKFLASGVLAVKQHKQSRCLVVQCSEDDNTVLTNDGETLYR